jgi:hypothetical protein
MYDILNILVCQGEWEHWKRRALRTASPCYRAVTLLEDIVKLSNLSIIYWFQITYLTFDFPLQLGFNLHFNTLVRTIQSLVGFLLKAAPDIKFQLNYYVKPFKPQSLSVSVFRGTLTPISPTSYNLVLSIYPPLCKFLRYNLLQIHYKIKWYLTAFS